MTFSVYFLEFLGTSILAFFASLLGKSYAHLILGATLFLTGTLFVHNCFNPAIALSYLVNKQITFPTFINYVVIELLSAVVAFNYGIQFKKYL